jgi:TPP-dependent pyruvate/acetoin dehydrogenase alpha subunit
LRFFPAQGGDKRFIAQEDIMVKTKTNTEDYLRMYRQMMRIRSFEDNANQLYLSAKMPGLPICILARKPLQWASAKRLK